MSESSLPKQSSRDFVLVVTREGRIKTLRIRDITHLSPGHTRDTTTVFLTGETSHLEGLAVTIQEPCRVFQTRCECLLGALQRADCQGINEFFAPRPVLPEQQVG
ncbi:hypothetical protein [Deinococcus cellulosilyticus]|uniref:Uncharacterized protein n=1 Tax=Deinococcus cellulosilyticus (strain DSM 18568 / NBRC 106333 / KACC 11606 / 5516J-15) TaxID=1223518 RepID=A0A511N1V5_DEIC1|nr:hypothetical protein [Deinococcus cellulosilyticus]GEM46833.1 hypothetical protein DC3_24680 [Deinococcus cellulosilyticus NBRC 106333 = KACC 11606]